MYGLTDFIDEFGGYLGLFLGGSILSIFEMLDKFIEKQLHKGKVTKKPGKESMVILQPSKPALVSN